MVRPSKVASGPAGVALPYTCGRDAGGHALLQYLAHVGRAAVALGASGRVAQVDAGPSLSLREVEDEVALFGIQPSVGSVVR